MKKNLLFIFLVSISFFYFGQATSQKKEYTATRILHPPKIDGILDDSCWLNIPVATDFIQWEPNPGSPSRQKTEVKLVYDNSAIYIGAFLYDTSPDSILKELSKRDNVFMGPNADAFAVVIDTYRDGINAVFFGVSAAGVQADTKISGPNNFDDSWNVVWESKVKISDKGWSVEMKIPYSALRFPKKVLQQWGIHFWRQLRRHKESSSWNPIIPTEQGFVQQAGILNGISNIESPLRLSLSPYLSATADNYLGKNSYSFSGGADIKYGINEWLTMDMMLIPDFSQARSDDRVLNLSPFEIRYSEQRQFFNEGTELFKRANIFYSRRVGGQPLKFNTVQEELNPNEIILKNPPSSQLYNATKISGRTKSKLGIGFFNAITAPAFATIQDTISNSSREIMTNPLTNYNVLVLDQGLPNNSYLSLINTNVIRNGSAYDANVTGTEFKFANKKNKFALWGQGALSQLHFPDSSKPYIGEMYSLSTGKISGNYTNSLTYRVISNKYNPNDLGFLERNNQVVIKFDQSYGIFKPFWKINKMSNDLGIDYFMLYTPRTYAWFNTDWNTYIQFKNYYSFGFFAAAQPFHNFDYYETRMPGRFYLYPKNYEVGTSMSSDSRKPLRIGANISYRVFSERNRTIFHWSISPTYRFSNRFNMNYSFYNEIKNDNTGWVTFLGDTIIFGVRDLKTQIHTLEGNYIFTPTMSFSLRVRHYWSQVKYKSYFAVNDEGKSSPTSYNSNNDINFNAFNVDMVFTWQFLPGSEMSIVWKNAILTQGQTLFGNYFENASKTISSPQQNNFSLKILYYLDYQSVRRRK
jgi:hypothetical protein